MSYWGYGKEFNEQRQTLPYLPSAERKQYVEKKRRKFNMARAHAEDLAKIAMDIMTLKGKHVNKEDS